MDQFAFARKPLASFHVFFIQNLELGYQYLYLRCDFKSGQNMAYAFVDFVTPQDVLAFATQVKGKQYAIVTIFISHLDFALTATVQLTVTSWFNFPGQICKESKHRFNVTETPQCRLFTALDSREVNRFQM